MSGVDPLSERVLILAPQGRDAQIAAMILTEAGFPADIRGTLPELSRELAKGAGLAIITDEAVRHADLRPLAAVLGEQPSWSDLPIVLITHRGGGTERNPAAARLAEVLGNVTFLERPFHPTTLASVVRPARRGRGTGGLVHEDALSAHPVHSCMTRGNPCEKSRGKECGK